MATYVSNQIRAFKAPGDPCDLPLNSQSLFHMKTYNSATDSRAWAFTSQDRKQYIFELFAANSASSMETNMGKYVNFRALMHTLLGNKDADIYYLQSQLKVLEAFLEDVNLNDQQRKTLECLKKQPINQMWSKAAPDDELSLDEIENHNENKPTNRDQIIFELNQRIKAQETELERQRVLAEDAANEQIAALNRMRAERDNLRYECGKLQKSFDTVRNTKASSNNDLLLKAQISELRLHMRRKEARKFMNLKMARSDQVAIFPEVKSTHEVSAVTSQTYIDITKIIEERNVLQDTVRKLLSQMENLRQLDTLIEKHLPDRNDRMAGDHASQVSQTLPYLQQAETELKREIQLLKGQLSAFQIKNLEFDRLCLRISELQLVQKEHEETKIKYNIKFMEQTKSITQYLHQIDYLKDRSASLQSEVDRYKKCEEENNILSDRCKNLQAIIESQQGKVRYLENCKSLVVESESKINELREELDKKSSIIKISEDKLVMLQAQLRESINSLTCETTILKNSLLETQTRIEELLENENMSQALIRKLQEELATKDVLLQALELEKVKSKMLPKILQERDNMIQHLRLKLLDLQRDNDKLGTMTSRLHCYIMSTSNSSNSFADNSNAHPAGVNGKCMDNICQAMQQLQSDLSLAKSSCDVTNFYRLQARYKDLQSSAKNQVHWLATELRNCKQEVQFLQCLIKDEKG